jgi:NAD(P)-dependent dehydrogenase (short-subunit alcohol dehydrogenase family)
MEVYVTGKLARKIAVVTGGSAGIGPGIAKQFESGTLGELTEEHFDKTFNINLRGLPFTVQKALPLLARSSQ